MTEEKQEKALQIQLHSAQADLEQMAVATAKYMRDKESELDRIEKSKGEIMSQLEKNEQQAGTLGTNLEREQMVVEQKEQRVQADTAKQVEQGQQILKQSGEKL